MTQKWKGSMKFFFNYLPIVKCLKRCKLAKRKIKVCEMIKLIPFMLNTLTFLK